MKEVVSGQTEWTTVPVDTHVVFQNNGNRSWENFMKDIATSNKHASNC